MIHESTDDDAGQCLVPADGFEEALQPIELRCFLDEMGDNEFLYRDIFAWVEIESSLRTSLNNSEWYPPLAEQHK